MTSAIFEILILLTVSCLIGIFFTYRFWKAKYNTLQSEIDQLKAQMKQLSDNYNREQSKNAQLESDLVAAREAKAQAKPVAKTAPAVEDKQVAGKLRDEIELLNEQLDEKEREIEELSKELENRKISYYKQIDGKRYKAITLKMADEAIAGQGDGRISKEDAEQIFATISDGKAYTQVEKDTMRYLRENYNWTDGADALFRTKVRSWAAKGHEIS